MTPATRNLGGLLAVLLSTGCAGSQAVPSTFEPLTELSEGQRIRLTAPPLETREARVWGVDEVESVLSLEFEDRLGGDEATHIRVPFEDVEAMWTHHRRTWLGGALGASVGLAAGLLLGASLPPDDPGAATTAFGLIGTGVGGLVGALVGSATSGWRLQFSRGASPAGRMSDP